MEQERISKLISRQKEIYFEIQELNQQSFEIQEKLANYILEKETDSKKPSKKELLESLGFIVSSKYSHGTNMNIIEKDNVKSTIIFKKSKFHTSSNYNAWYTFKPDTTDIVDFVILEFYTLTNKPVYAVLSKALFSQIAEQTKSLPDGRFHVFLLGDDQKAMISDLNIDISETLNNFDILSQK